MSSHNHSAVDLAAPDPVKSDQPTPRLAKRPLNKRPSDDPIETPSKRLQTQLWISETSKFKFTNAVEHPPTLPSTSRRIQAPDGTAPKQRDTAESQHQVPTTQPPQASSYENNFAYYQKVQDGMTCLSRRLEECEAVIHHIPEPIPPKLRLFYDELVIMVDHMQNRMHEAQRAERIYRNLYRDLYEMYIVRLTQLSDEDGQNLQTLNLAYAKNRLRLDKSHKIMISFLQRYLEHDMTFLYEILNGLRE